MLQKENTRKKSAFTLLELAVVITIIGLIGWMGLSASKDMIDTANQVATQNRLDTIEKALFTFWQKNGRLPCPADATLATTHANYGIEASNAGGYCAFSTPSANFVSAIWYKATEGVVPIVTLGLPKDFIYDGWKRKIAYAVTPAFTLGYAKTSIQPKSSSCVADTAIRIKDASGADRSTSAIYVLVSYGKNGHGGYPVKGSTRYNSGSTNADELINCHCTSAAVNSTYDGNYVQRNQNLNEKTAASYFDDIVRYKERWQLATPEDAINDDGYRGPDLAIGYEKVGSGTVYVYKNKCGAFVKQADLSPLPTNIPRGVAFTANNQHLLTYSGLGCNLYKISTAGTLTNLPSAFSTACPYNSTAVMALSNNGYLAISTSTSSAVINLWKQSGDRFIALPSLTHSDASVAELSFSPDAKLLAVRSATTTSKIYKRKGDSFSSAAADITQPANLSFYNTPVSLVFSPDGRYLVDMEYWTANSVFYLSSWRVLEGSTVSFAQLTSFSPFTLNSLNNIVFSPDGRYFIIDDVAASLLCNIDPGDVFCGGSILNSGYMLSVGHFWVGSTFNSAGKVFYSFSRDSNFFIRSREWVSKAPEIPIRVGVKSFMIYLGFFNSSGTTGGVPSRMMDQMLSGSTGGPVAFAH